jgi:hypothetical protein
LERDPLVQSRSSKQALDEAEATLDVEARKALMERVEKIMQDDVPAIIPMWRPVYTARPTGCTTTRRTRPSTTSSTRCGSTPDAPLKTAPRPALRARIPNACEESALPPVGQAMREGAAPMVKLILQRLVQMALIMAVVSLVLFRRFRQRQVQEAACGQ